MFRLLPRYITKGKVTSTAERLFPDPFKLTSSDAGAMRTPSHSRRGADSGTLREFASLMNQSGFSKGDVRRTILCVLLVLELLQMLCLLLGPARLLPHLSPRESGVDLINRAHSARALLEVGPRPRAPGNRIIEPAPAS